jgi:hypothetical protein
MILVFQVASSRPLPPSVTSLHLIERRVIQHLADSTPKSARFELANHQRRVRAGLEKVETGIPSRLETEPRIVGGVAENHHDELTRRSASRQPGFYERGTDALALKLRQYRHGTQTHRVRRAGRRPNLDGRQQNVADDVACRVLRDERNLGVRGSSEDVDEFGLYVRGEGLSEYIADGRSIARRLCSDSDFAHWQ